MNDNSSTFHLWAVLALSLLAVIIYSNSFNGGFVFDDQHNITANPHIRLNAISVETLSDAAFKSASPNRPVANISFALNYYLGGYHPAGYHLVNLLLHLINGILVYILAGLTFGRYAGTITGYDMDGIEEKVKLRVRPLSLFAALLFIAHPIQVQSVTYIVQRMNSMAAMFYLLALILYIHGRLSRIKWKQGTFMAGSLICWLLALGSKEIAATLPMVILLYEWYFFQDLSRDWLHRNCKYLIGLTVLLGLILCLFLGSSPLDEILGSYSRRDFTMGQRILTQFRVLVFYLSLLVYPHPSRLNLMHAFTTSHSLIDPVTTLLSLVMLAGLLGLGVYLARKHRLISFGILWFFIHLMMESSFIGLEMVFEHRLYLPLVGVALIAGCLLLQLSLKNRSWAVAVAVAMIVSMGTATHLRNRIWQDPITLLSDVVAKNPRSYRAQYNLGSDLARAGRLDEAVYHLSKALRLKPDYTKARNNLGLALFKQGRLNQAIDHFSGAVRIQPGNSAAHYNLGVALEEKGDLAAAMGHYFEALRIKPDFAEAHNSLGVALQGQGNLKAAVFHFSQALRLNPDYAEAHHNLGYALEMQGHVKKAMDHYFTALSIRPQNTKTYVNLGAALTRQGFLEEAARCYREALRLEPQDAGAYNNLGVALQQQGKLTEAVAHYAAALEVKPGYAEAHNNMGIAMARQGLFQEAVDHFTRALEIRPEDAQARHNLELARRGMVRK